MVSGSAQLWYKRSWIWISILLLVIIIGSLIMGKYDEKQAYYQIASEEYIQIYSQVETKSAQISLIENRYSKNGFIQYSDFSDEDLNNYQNLLWEQEKNYDELITWVVSNEEYLRYIGKTDLVISEMLRELRTTKERLEVARLQIANIQTYRNM